MSELEKLVRFSEEFKAFLIEKEIALERVYFLDDNKKETLATAFIREKRKSWKITKKEQNLIDQLKEVGK